jgi:hypothetical protein
MWIVPVNSDDCATDWNYNFHGADWVCRCNEGQEQSPIDLDHFGNLEKITTFFILMIGMLSLSFNTDRRTNCKSFSKIICSESESKKMKMMFKINSLELFMILMELSINHLKYKFTLQVFY